MESCLYIENMFNDDCKAKLKSLTFYGVGIHQQNLTAESTIKHLTLAGRTMLLRGQRQRPEYIATMPQPFALLASADCIDICPFSG